MICSCQEVSAPRITEWYLFPFHLFLDNQPVSRICHKAPQHGSVYHVPSHGTSVLDHALNFVFKPLDLKYLTLSFTEKKKTHRIFPFFHHLKPHFMKENRTL